MQKTFFFLGVKIDARLVQPFVDISMGWIFILFYLLTLGCWQHVFCLFLSFLSFPGRGGGEVGGGSGFLSVSFSAYIGMSWSRMHVRRFAMLCY